MIVLALAAGLACVQADEPAQKEGVQPCGTWEPAQILRAESPVTIDGVLDEPCWQRATPVQCVYKWGSAGEAGTRPWMTARFAWDEKYLYIAYEAFDENIQAKGSGVIDGPEGNRRPGCLLIDSGTWMDIAEFQISFGDERMFWEIHHNALNQFNDVWITVVDRDWGFADADAARFGMLMMDYAYIPDEETRVPDKRGSRLAAAVRLAPKADGSPSTVNDDQDADGGYTAELRLPWYGLGAPSEARTWLQKDKAPGPWKMAGQEVHIMSICQNGEVPGLYRHSSPTFPGGWYSLGYAHFPRYRFEEGSGAP